MIAFSPNVGLIDINTNVVVTYHVDEAKLNQLIIDHNDPLFLHPLDTPRLSLKSKNLIRFDTYGFWSKL